MLSTKEKMRRIIEELYDQGVIDTETAHELLTEIVPR